MRQKLIKVMRSGNTPCCNRDMDTARMEELEHVSRTVHKNRCSCGAIFLVDTANLTLERVEK